KDLEPKLCLGQLRTDSTYRARVCPEKSYGKPIARIAERLEGHHHVRTRTEVDGEEQVRQGFRRRDDLAGIAAARLAKIKPGQFAMLAPAPPPLHPVWNAPEFW